MRALFFICLVVSLCGSIPEVDYLQRVASHLIIGDSEGAVEESREALDLYPDSEPLRMAHVEALAKSGRLGEALSSWKGLPDGETALLETVAWSFIEEAKESRQVPARLFSVLSAAQTSDVRAVKLILAQMRSTNAFLRTIGIQLASRFRDEELISELKRMLEREKVWYVRLGVIDALGKLQVEEAASTLEGVVADDRSPIEERAVAAQALVSMVDAIDPTPFFSSNRAGLRYLACEIVTHLDMRERCGDIAALFADASPMVRVAALQTIGMLGMGKQYTHSIEALTADTHPYVAITAAWALIQLDQKKGERAFRKWLMGDDLDLRRLAAAALTRSGKVGQRLAVQALKSEKDPFARVTLAYGIMGQRVAIDLACSVIFDFLQNEQGRIMVDAQASPHFEFIAPSEVAHTPHMAQYPTYVDQHTRLRLLNILALHRHPQAEEAVKTFLTRRIDGLTYVASMMLLQEGESDAIPIIKHLLTDPDQGVRLQAALVLAMSGNDPEAIATLKQLYPDGDRETKLTILGALGHIGGKESIPFLIAQLEEPFQQLRLVAASALLQCLYH